MTDTPRPRSRARSEAARTAANEDTSVRRIGEALLLAQNRARVSTQRANRSEHILRTVLSQINLQSGVLLHELEEYPRSMSFDSLSDWDMLRTLIESSGLEPMAPTAAPQYPFPAPRSPSAVQVETERTSFALSMAEARGTPHTLSSAPHADQSEDLKAVTRDVVVNLHVAARTAERRIQKMATATPLYHANTSSSYPLHGGRWFTLRRVLMRMFRMETRNCYDDVRPWQFMAGVMVGFALGVVSTKRMLMEQAVQTNGAQPQPQPRPSALVMDQASLSSSAPLPQSAFKCRGDALTQRQMTKLHLAASRLPVTFAMEDMSYLLHPPTEVS